MDKTKDGWWVFDGVRDEYILISSDELNQDADREIAAKWALSSEYQEVAFLEDAEDGDGRYFSPFAPRLPSFPPTPRV